MPTRRCFKCMNEISGATQICPKCGFDNGNLAQPSPTALPCGTVLNKRYIIGRMLGQGGFGITYIAYDYMLDTSVCIKEFFPYQGAMRSSDSIHVYWNSDSAGTEMIKQGRETFMKEARKAVRVRNLSSVVSVWDVFYENDTAYIVMEYISGITLKDYLIRRGRVMDIKECFDLLVPVMRGLQEVHKLGIVHRDISPDNLMIRNDGKVILLDLGAAKDMTKGTGQSSEVIAKRGFSPPEQYTKKAEIGSWTDVYAMCATIYWCMTGNILPEAIDRYLGYDIDFPSFIPQKMASILKHGLELKPERRIKDFGELLKEFELDAVIGVSSGDISKVTKVPVNADNQAVKLIMHYMNATFYTVDIARAAKVNALNSLLPYASGNIDLFTDRIVIEYIKRPNGRVSITGTIMYNLIEPIKKTIYKKDLAVVKVRTIKRIKSLYYEYYLYLETNDNKPLSIMMKRKAVEDFAELLA